MSLHDSCLPFVPSVLQEITSRHLDRLLGSLNGSQLTRLEKQLTHPNHALAKQLAVAITGSEYLLDQCCRNPDLLFNGLLVDAPFEKITPLKIIDAFTIACSDPLDAPAFHQLLRQLRCRYMCSLYWRDLNGLADLDEVTQAMTAMAEVCLQLVVDFHYRLLQEKHGFPVGQHSGMAQPLMIVGMGKLGGAELNVSSDIDLMFVYPEAGETHHPTKSIDNQKFFTLLGQAVVKALGEQTQEGFVFRVDMRLRPYGQSGALVCHFQALENYYQTQGRDWERFAAIKARVIACAQVQETHESLIFQLESTERFNQLLSDFTYRKYVDFSLIESLRQLKALIIEEVKRLGLHNHIKLGSGGIRDIEFIAQTMQLLRGGHDRRLQERNLLSTLSLLLSCQYMEVEQIETLQSAYRFLRTLEHRIQAWQDAQTQRLPEQEEGWERLAFLMGFRSLDKFKSALESHREKISCIFQSFIDEPKPDGALSSDVNQWKNIWLNIASSSADQLNPKGATINESALIKLREFESGRRVQSLSSVAREQLDKLMPPLLSTIFLLSSPEHPFEHILFRTLNWLEEIVNRTSYLSLLSENPSVFTLLVKLLSDSAWIASALTQTPLLLDQLLYPEQLFSTPNKQQLSDDLRQRFLRIEENDEEGAMEVLRFFRSAHNFHAAASEVMNQLPLMKVSDYLTFTAEVVLEQVLLLAWTSMVKRHGLPEGQDSQDSPQFLVVGYGKLGGCEMSYQSDLDLVFIYEGDPQGFTQGKKPLEHHTFYTRLGQKMIHYLNTRTLSGPLYTVDMRLRPSGNSGLLVTSRSANDMGFS